MRAKVCPHVNRTRTPHPHRQTAPAQMSPHKFSPQTRFHDLALKTFTSLTKSFVDSFQYQPFFPYEKNLYFLKMGKHLCFTVSLYSKKALFKKVLYTIYDAKSLTWRKREKKKKKKKRKKKKRKKEKKKKRKKEKKKKKKKEKKRKKKEK